MATTFSYFGYQYEIIDEEKKEVALNRAVYADERAVIPCSVEYNGKTYKVTAIGPVKVRVFRKTAGVRETDGRKKNQWKEAPRWVQDGWDYISPFTGYSEFYEDAKDRYGINKKITTIILPDSINELGNAAFRRCQGLKEVVNFPKGITKISDRLFSGCHALESIVLPEGITSIEKFAFIGCSSLKEISIPSSVRTIDYCAFADSEQSKSGLEVVNIMNSEGGVIIHPEAFTDRVKINYLGKQTANKAKADKKETPKQEVEQVAAPAPTIDLDKLIEAVVADGVITDKERAVVLKKATAAGYDADEVEILLDGLTLESAGKVKKNAVKADMESMIAYQRTDEEVEPVVVEAIKKSATYGDYTINIASNNIVSVLKGGVACNNVKGALREIAENEGFEYDPAWTTRQFGSKLVDFLNEKK